ncbi:MAG: hypothetical protein JWN04_1206 [Myxococcaceae bacterium]|nr:hypothetical protein [Myxococcaceae bacterium]
MGLLRPKLASHCVGWLIVPVRRRASLPREQMAAYGARGEVETRSKVCTPGIIDESGIDRAEVETRSTAQVRSKR